MAKCNLDLQWDTVGIYGEPYMCAFHTIFKKKECSKERHQDGPWVKNTE